MFFYIGSCFRTVRDGADAFAALIRRSRATTPDGSIERMTTMDNLIATIPKNSRERIDVSLSEFDIPCRPVAALTGHESDG